MNQTNIDKTKEEYKNQKYTDMPEITHAIPLKHEPAITTKNNPKSQQLPQPPIEWEEEFDNKFDKYIDDEYYMAISPEAYKKLKSSIQTLIDASYKRGREKGKNENR